MMIENEKTTSEEIEYSNLEESISEFEAEQNQETWVEKQNNSKILKAGVAVSVVSSLLSLGISGYALLSKANDKNKTNSDGKVIESVSDNSTSVTISSDGYWVINGTKTEVKAEANDGEDGLPAPQIVSASVLPIDKWGISTYIKFILSDGSYFITTPVNNPSNNHYYTASTKQDVIDLVNTYKASKIKLESDIEFDSEFSIDREVIFDLNGYEFNYTPTTALAIQNGAKVTFENGSMKVNASKRWNSSIVVSEGSKLVLNNVEYEAFGANVLVKGADATVEINESSLIGGAYCVSTNANVAENYNVNIVIRDSMLEAVGCSTDPMDYDNAPVVLNVPGSLVMQGCYVIGDRQSVIVRGGDAVIEDCLIVNTGNYANKTKYLTSNWSEGNEVPMAAIVVGNRTDKSYEYDATCKIINSEVYSQHPDVPQVYVYSGGTYKATLEYDNKYITDVEFGGKATAKVEIESIQDFENALTSLPAGSTLVLQHNVNPGAIHRLYSTNQDIDFVLDLNGNAFENTLMIYANDLSTGEDYGHKVNVTIKNGTLGSLSSACVYGFVPNGSSNMNVTLENVELLGYYGGLYTNGTACFEGANITATNCTFSASDSNSSSAYLAAAANYTFNNCSFTGAGGIYIKAGTLTLNNCIVQATGDEATGSYNGNGANTTGAGITIDSAYNYNTSNNKMIVSINGGSVSSLTNYAVYEISTAPTTEQLRSYAVVSISESTVLTSPKTDVVKSENNVISKVSLWDGSATALGSPVENVITISTAAELAGLAEAVNNGTTFKGITIKLASDIDLNNLAWTPIGFGCKEQVTSFRGIFDGQGHIIYNLNVTTFVGGGQGDIENATAGVGLFGNLYLATIKNVHIKNAEVYGNHFVGALAGYTSYSHIINCSVTNAIINCEYANSDDSGDKAGALIGMLQNSTAKNCNAVSSTVSAGRDAGQLIGCVSGADATPESGDDVVENCSATNVEVSANGTGKGTNIKNEIVGRQ